MTTQEILAKGKQYTIVFLKKGPNYYKLGPEVMKVNQLLHVQYLMGLRENNIIAINGPISDEGDIRGVSIYNLADKEEVKTFVENDPGVISGRFVYEIHNWFSFPGDKLGQDA